MQLFIPARARHAPCDLCRICVLCSTRSLHFGLLLHRRLNNGQPRQLMAMQQKKKKKLTFPADP